MPRKTDGIEFEIHPRPTKGEDGKPLLYVRPAKGRKKSFKQLEDLFKEHVERIIRTIIVFDGPKPSVLSYAIISHNHFLWGAKLNNLFELYNF